MRKLQPTFEPPTPSQEVAAFAEQMDGYFY